MRSWRSRIAAWKSVWRTPISQPSFAAPDLSRERSEQRPDRFAAGEKVDAAVTQVDKGSRKVSVSIKALEIAEEKEAVAQYGSTDSGASLGDILGAALDKAKQQDDTPDAPDAPDAPEAGPEGS